MVLLFCMMYDELTSKTILNFSRYWMTHTMENLQTSELTTFQLKAARRALGVSLKQVSKETGIAETALIRLESSDLGFFPKHTSLTTVFRLRQFLETKGIIFLANNTLQFITSDQPRVQIKIVLPQDKS